MAMAGRLCAREIGLKRFNDSMRQRHLIGPFCCVGFLLNVSLGLLTAPSRASTAATRVRLRMSSTGSSVGDPDVHVEVISDFACPWCYVGKARLNAAIDAFGQSRDPGDDAPRTGRVHVSFSPYMIDPRTQPDGEKYLAYNRRRWGGDGWTASLKRSSRKDGCEFAKWVTWPNSLLAHRLQKFAEIAGKGDQVSSLVFQTIYERGGNASDIETLVSLAAEAGLSSADARAFLSSREGEQEVLREDNRAKTELGVRGVPFFVVRRAPRRDDGEGAAGVAADDEPKVVLNGAVAPGELLRAFDSVSRR